MKNKTVAMTQKNNRHIRWGRCLSMLLMIANILVCLSAQVFAAEATTIWDKANEIMKDVYNQILLISTIAAIVTASIVLLMMNFSKSGRTVDESRSWLKRIVITKIDSFMSFLKINVGHTDGSMLAEAMIALRGAGAVKNIAGHGGNTSGGASSSGASSSPGFMSGGLAGVVSRKFTNSAVKNTTGDKTGGFYE